MKIEQKFENKSFLTRVSSLGNIIWTSVLLIITIVLFYISENQELNTRLSFSKYAFLLLLVFQVIMTFNRSKNSLIEIKKIEDKLYLDYLVFDKRHSEILNLSDVKIEEKRTWDRYSIQYLSISTKSKRKLKFHLTTYKKFGEGKMTELIHEINGRV